MSALNFLKKSFQLQFQRRFISISSTLNKHKKASVQNDSNVEEEDLEYKELSESCFSTTDHNCFIIHPYVKWGPQKVKDTSSKQQIEEAVALIRTLAPWKVHDTLAVPLDNLDKKQLFGTGTLEKLRQQIQANKDITAVFINMGTLKMVQLEELEKTFQVPILDRYKVVMQILRLHAKSKHAKLQVALAEIPYLRGKLRKFDSHFMASSNLEVRKLMLLKRENKLKNEIKSLRSQRELLRNKRKQIDYPVIAVVGYTNAGKTSLIKSLTGDTNLQPKNQLFATLDVTMHRGLLPSKLEVLYVDTVGFISNIPTTLIECFVATLEDAIFADIILHVEDLSTDDFIHQRNHVLSTLKQLAEKTDTKEVLNKIISVGNKCDIGKNIDQSMICVSAKNEIGIDVLRSQLETAVLKSTKRISLTIRIPTGEDEIRWLYKNANVVSEHEDLEDSQFQKVKIIITHSKLEQFKHYFLKKCN